MNAQHSANRTNATFRELPVMLGALIVFAVLAFLIVGRIQTDYEEYPAFSTISPKPEGAKAFWLLCQELGLGVEQYYGDEYDYPQRCAMVVLQEDGVDAAMWLLNPFDCSAVLDWVEAGNCLIVATPPGSMLATSLGEQLGSADLQAYAADPNVIGQFQQAGQPGQAIAMSRVFQPGQQYTFPKERPPLWQALGSIEAAGSFNAEFFPDADVLLAVSDPPEPVVLHFVRGRGEVIWLLRPELLSNAWLSRQDNVHLGWALASYGSRYGRVYFDEHVHGYSMPQKSALQLIFTTTGGWLLLAGLGSVLLVMAGAAVQPAKFIVQAVPPRRDSTEMVLAQADLYRRARVTGLLGKGILDSFRRMYKHVSREGRLLDDASFKEMLAELLKRSGVGLPFVASFISSGLIPQRPQDVVRFSQELASLISRAHSRPAGTIRHRLQ
jgi:hypothetical protein